MSNKSELMLTYSFGSSALMAAYCCNAALLLQFLVIFAVTQSGINFKCYICESKANPNCSDPVGRNLPEVIECEDIFPLLLLQLGIDPFILTESLFYGCQKLEVQDSEGVRVTVRSCVAVANGSSTACSEKNNLEEIEEKFTLEYCGVCEDELCNASIKIKKSPAILFMSISFASLILLQ